MSAFNCFLAGRRNHNSKAGNFKIDNERQTRQYGPKLCQTAAYFESMTSHSTSTYNNHCKGERERDLLHPIFGT